MVCYIKRRGDGDGWFVIIKRRGDGDGWFVIIKRRGDGDGLLPLKEGVMVCYH